MKPIYADIDLFNLTDLSLAESGFRDPSEIKQVYTRMRVDNSIYRLCINEEIQKILQLEVKETRSFRFPDGRTVLSSIVTTIKLRYRTRTIISEAVVLPGDSEPILGKIPLEMLDVLIDPGTNQLYIPPGNWITQARRLPTIQPFPPNWGYLGKPEPVVYPASKK